MSHECGYYCQGDVHAISTMMRKGLAFDIAMMKAQMIGKLNLEIQGKYYKVIEVVDVRPAHEAVFVPDERWSGGEKLRDGVPMLTFIRIGEEVE